jgi:hypothetical protein
MLNQANIRGDLVAFFARQSAEAKWLFRGKQDRRSRRAIFSTHPADEARIATILLAPDRERLD